MPIVFGESVMSVEEIVRAFGRYGDRVRGTYRARYVFGGSAQDLYGGTQLERPESLRDNPGGVIFPWEQVIVAAAACAGSDYPMLAAHQALPLSRTELVVSCVYDPRGEFDGLAGFRAPADARHCFLSLKLCATLNSPAPKDALERLHRRVLTHNMVLGALRGIPTTDELIVRR